MIAQIYQVAGTYTTRRWITAAIAFGLAIWALMLYAVSFADANAKAEQLLFNFIGLPTMFGAIGIVLHAKWQFVHPRSRLMPCFHRAHLVVIVALMAVVFVAMPTIAAVATQTPILGILACIFLAAALMTWAIHSARFELNLASMAVLFSMMFDSVNGIWFDRGEEFLVFRLAALAAGTSGLVAWLMRLVRMTEEGDDYNIPVQSQFGQSSRMEKSEARRFMVRMVSRSRITSWLTDWWHDKIARLKIMDEADRKRLFRYGLAAVPAPAMALFLVGMLLAIVWMQVVMTAKLGSRGRGGFDPWMMAAIQTSIFSLVVPAMVLQKVAMRLPRLSQELMFPLTRKSLVDGLFAAMRRETLWTTTLFCGIGLAVAMVSTSDVITPKNEAVVIATLIAIQPITLGGCFALALIKSGFGRIVAMLGAIYSIIPLAMAMASVGIFYSLYLSLAIDAAVFAFGLLTIRWAKRRWMQAEFG